MNAYNYIPQSPFEKAQATTRSAEPAPSTQEASQARSLAADYNPPGNNLELSLAPAPQGPVNENGLSLEQKAMMTMGMSLLFDALKDTSFELNDFMKILNQSAQQRSADRVFKATEKAAEPQPEPEMSLTRRFNMKLGLGQELDMLMPSQKPENTKSKEVALETSPIPKSPAMQMGIEMEQDLAPQRQLKPAKAPAISFSPSLG